MADGDPAFEVEPAVPWVESDRLQPYLDAIGAEPELRRFAGDLARDGVACIDFDDGDTARLVDAVVAETEGYFQNGVTRVQDAWRESAAVRALALHPKVLRFLKAGVWAGTLRLPDPEFPARQSAKSAL